jgi:hypothetical protein
VKRSPSVAASMGSVTLAMNALELALDNETHVFYLSLAAKANALPGWNVRTPKAAPAAKEPVFAVKIGTPFPVRVMVGDSTTQLSVALTYGRQEAEERPRLAPALADAHGRGRRHRAVARHHCRQRVL